MRKIKVFDMNVLFNRIITNFWFLGIIDKDNYEKHTKGANLVKKYKLITSNIKNVELNKFISLFYMSLTIETIDNYKLLRLILKNGVKNYDDKLIFHFLGF